MIVRHVLPHFGTRIVRRACLRPQHASLRNFAHVQISQFSDSTLRQKYVCALDVTMADFKVVKCFQTPNDLDEVVPDSFLSQLLIFALLLADQLQNVAPVCVFHHDAEAVGCVLEEGLLVANDIGVLDACQDAHFVESVLFLFAGQFLHFYFFHGVD